MASRRPGIEAPRLVEVGSGFNPVIFQGTLEISKCVIIESNEAALYGPNGVRANLERKPHLKAKVRLFRGDASLRWPLSSNFADEVFFGNVFGFKDTEVVDLDFLRRERRAERLASGTSLAGWDPLKASDYVTPNKMLAQAYRVLRPGGTLTVFEDSSPDQMSPSRLRSLLWLANFVLKQDAYTTSKNELDWEDTVKPYKTSPDYGTLEAPAYIMFAEKPA